MHVSQKLGCTSCTTLEDVLLRYGAVYFVALLILNVVTFLSSHLHTDNNFWSPILLAFPQFQTPLLSILVSHFLLNLREVAYGTPASISELTSLTLHFDQRITSTAPVQRNGAYIDIRGRRRQEAHGGAKPARDREAAHTSIREASRRAHPSRAHVSAIAASEQAAAGSKQQAHDKQDMRRTREDAQREGRAASSEAPGAFSAGREDAPPSRPAGHRARPPRARCPVPNMQGLAATAELQPCATPGAAGKIHVLGWPRTTEPGGEQRAEGGVVALAPGGGIEGGACE
ncbi:hypothetical protein CERSUDRAFT_97145 [Gelatoporia subvermispora B]|uniref:Uncharacterized protein n=1 Tax=Ceriporiopsis subvermispora (strain B) TaxID=914234 RepID=M2PF55_CERS8|nr:hypothetical protein CERSUDRAFT_97145 [Gelatoporia subvermispora B]